MVLYDYLHELQKNKWDFFVFICLATLTATIAAAVAVQSTCSKDQINFTGRMFCWAFKKND